MTEAEEFGLPRNEETTTEELLLSLARNHKDRGLEIKAYTKNKESETGADWAFWFSDARGVGVGVRVQAKRLFADSFCYHSLFHQSKSQRAKSRLLGTPTPNQCETLLSHQDGLVPIYVFYNSDSLRVLALLDRIYLGSRGSGCSYWSEFGDWGISTASALAVKNANWGKNNRPGDFPMVPWHWLVCPCCWHNGPADVSLPSLVGSGLRELYSEGPDGKLEDQLAYPDFGFSFEPTEKSPEWVGLLNEGLARKDLLDAHMRRLKLKGVAVITEESDRDE